MRAGRILAAALAGALLASATALAAFTASSANPANSFQAAASFPGMRLATGTYTGNAADDRAIAVGFRPDVVIVKGHATVPGAVRTSTMSGNATKDVAGASALATNRIQSLDDGGFTVGTSDRVNAGSVIYFWIALRANPGSLKVGSYTGDGVASRAITGVGFAPRYVAVLPAGANESVQRFAGMTRAFQFNADTGATNRITSLDADGFTVGNSATTNASGAEYHYVALRSRSNNVVAGAYTGTGFDNTNVTGVGFAPQYVLIRANDTATGRVALHRPASLGGDNTLSFTGAARANAIQALQADGFQLGTDSNVNAGGVTYFVLALRDRP